ncbi:hypothetical protein M9Y10_010142 [Tritrichomonas musculus]|uniref:Initiator binding domain-containing protein n=1 Tax=Tritrichomonas musculus TaxID=1915356 RepID=A0ABR2IRK0_9EUKA
MMTLKKLQQYVTLAKPKLKLRTILIVCLNYIDSHPEDIIHVGVCWYDDYHIIINTRIFGNLIKRKPNSINKNFRDNYFKCIRTTSSMRNKKFLSFTFNNLPDPKGWVLQRSDNFQRGRVYENINDEIKDILKKWTNDDLIDANNDVCELYNSMILTNNLFVN